MRCTICGEMSDKNQFVFKKILSDDLVLDWNLTPKQRRRRNEKESMFCPNCGCSMRSRALAGGIIKSKPFGSVKNLVEWVEEASKIGLKVAEINYCGDLHPVLNKLPGLILSQYSEISFRARFFNWLKGIKKEDITNLSYEDNSFDLVVHSEVLEHVYDVDRALSECRRILKTNGVCVFTIPVIMERKTRKRAGIDRETGEIKHLLKPSYHGSGEKDNLVFWEFGGDFVKNRGLKILYKLPENGVYVFTINKGETFVKNRG